MKSAYITSRSESDRRARQIAREEVEKAKRDFCPDCVRRMEAQTISIMCKVLHDNFGFGKHRIKELIACAEAIGIFINDSGSGYECAVDWMRDEIGIDLNA
jgi:hypothetical protein